MKNFLIGLLMSAGWLLAAQAQCAPVDFEDLHADGDLTGLTSPYAGLNWGEDWYYGDTAVEGYDNGAHSGIAYLTNGYGVNHLAVGSAAAFNFAGAWFAAPNTNGAVASWINITAFDAAGQVIGSTGNVSIGQSYQWIAANFHNAARLDISRDDGWFVMDDFTVQSAVPEPGSLAMLLAGLGVMALIVRRRPHRGVDNAAC